MTHLTIRWTAASSFRIVAGVILATGAIGVASAQAVEGRGGSVADLCAAFPAAQQAADGFALMFAQGAEDLDDDGLPDRASLALVREVACNPDAPVPLATATTTAYEANLALFDAETGTAGLESFREAIAVLMLTNASTEASVKAVLALADPPFTLLADYTQVTCSAGVCMPAPTRNTAATGEFLDFEAAPRAPDEPYAADGDLDGDGVSNLTEYNNIVAQGGSLESFVIAATSDELDGTEPVRSEGGGCFIATAALGTPLALEVGRLRAWRDDSLLTNPAGAAFADVYYRLSPPIADEVATSNWLAGVVRLTLRPAIALTSSDGISSLALVGIAIGLAACVTVSGRKSRGATFPTRRRRTARGR
jgi:hypothetical protein